MEPTPDQPATPGDTHTPPAPHAHHTPEPLTVLSASVSSSSSTSSSSLTPLSETHTQAHVPEGDLISFANEQEQQGEQHESPSKSRASREWRPEEPDIAREDGPKPVLRLEASFFSLMGGNYEEEGCSNEEGTTPFSFKEEEGEDEEEEEEKEEEEEEAEKPWHQGTEDGDTRAADRGNNINKHSSREDGLSTAADDAQQSENDNLLRDTFSGQGLTSRHAVAEAFKNGSSHHGHNGHAFANSPSPHPHLHNHHPYQLSSQNHSIHSTHHQSDSQPPPFARRSVLLTVQSNDEITSSWSRSRTSLGIGVEDGNVGELNDGKQAELEDKFTAFSQVDDDELWTSFSHMSNEFQSAASPADPWGSFTDARQTSAADWDNLFAASSSGTSPSTPTMSTIELGVTLITLQSILDTVFPLAHPPKEESDSAVAQGPKSSLDEGHHVFAALAADAGKKELFSWNSSQRLRPSYMDTLSLRFVVPKRAKAVEMSGACCFDVDKAATRLWEMDLEDLRSWRDALLPRVNSLSAMLVDLLAEKDELNYEFELKQRVADAIVRVAERYDTETLSTSAAHSAAASSLPLLRRAPTKSYSRQVVMIPYVRSSNGISLQMCNQLVRILDALEHSKPQVHTFLAEYMASL